MNLKSRHQDKLNKENYTYDFTVKYVHEFIHSFMHCSTTQIYHC